MTDLTGVLGGSRLLDQPRYRGEVADWHAFLAEPGPALLEVGFDHGRRLLATAAALPDWRVAGVEVRKKRVHGVQVQAAERGLHNLFAWRVDARLALGGHTPEGRFDIVEVLFPTPWWDEKKREKRLLVTPAFLHQVQAVLRPGGVLLLATDVERYADDMREALAGGPLVLIEGWPRPAIEVQSRRERKCAREGLPVWRFAARRA